MLEVIKHAKANGKTVHIVNLDLSDAFGSLPHNLVKYVLEMFSVPDFYVMYIVFLVETFEFCYCAGWWGELQNFQYQNRWVSGGSNHHVVFYCLLPNFVQFYGSRGGEWLRVHSSGS